MRIILAGSGSFIARAVADICRASRIDVLPLRHDQDIREVLRAGDCLMNFAIAPPYRTGPL